MNIKRIFKGLSLAILVGFSLVSQQVPMAANEKVSKLQVRSVEDFSIETLDGEAKGKIGEGNTLYVFDKTTKLKVDYMKKDEYGESIDYEIRNDQNQVISDKVEIEYGSTIDFSSLGDGLYYIVLRSYNAIGVSDAATIIINIESVEATVGVEGPNGNTNPTRLVVGGNRDDVKGIWSIHTLAGEEVATGGLDKDPSLVLADLEDGKYTITNTVKASTLYGSELTSATVKEDFIIRTPGPTIVIDQKENPNSIIGIPNLDDSTIEWAIYDKNEQLIFEGIGTDVPKDKIDLLEDGEYFVIFYETVIDNLVEIAIDEFTINKPEKPIIPVNPENPDDKNKVVELVAKSTNSDVPQTGDTTSLQGIIVIGVVSAAAVYIIKRKREREN